MKTMWTADGRRVNIHALASGHGYYFGGCWRSSGEFAALGPLNELPPAQPGMALTAPPTVRQTVTVLGATVEVTAANPQAKVIRDGLRQYTLAVLDWLRDRPWFRGALWDAVTTLDCGRPDAYGGQDRARRDGRVRMAYDSYECAGKPSSRGIDWRLIVDGLAPPDYGAVSLEEDNRDQAISASAAYCKLLTDCHAPSAWAWGGGKHGQGAGDQLASDILSGCGLADIADRQAGYSVRRPWRSGYRGALADMLSAASTVAVLEAKAELHLPVSAEVLLGL